jgi:hypothetical protein
MKNDNRNGDWMWDGAAQEQIVYCNKSDNYCHETCAPEAHHIEAAYTGGGVPYYAGRHGVCHYCKLRFVPEVMSGSRAKPAPPSALNQHFI